MAAICNSSTDYLFRQTSDGNMPPTTGHTIAGWFKRTADNNAYEVAIAIQTWNAADHWKSWMAVLPSVETGYEDHLALGNANGGAVNPWPTTLVALDTWYYLAMVWDGDQHYLGYWYSWNGSSLTLIDSTVQSAISYVNYTPTSLEIMADTDASRYLTGKCCYVRVWDAALTQAEIEAELVSSVIIRTTNINTALGPCNSSSFANDVSGNGRNWTLGAGLTTSDFDSDVPSGLTGGGGSAVIMGRRLFILP